MARTGGASAATSARGKNAKKQKPTRADKKAARVARRQQRRETWRNLRQAFTLTRRSDRRLIPYLVLIGVGAAAVVYLIAFFLLGSPWLGIPVAVVIGLGAAMLLFSRRAQRSMYTQAEDQPGAAAWMLQNQIRGDWRTTPAVAGTAQLDAVHRVLGRPGIVLVGEGDPRRVRSLIAQEKRKIARVAGDTPIYDVVVGRGDGAVPLGKLNAHLLKLPRNLDRNEVSTLERRMSALAAVRQPMPQGPLPPGAKMRNVQRTVRRRS